MDHAIEGSSPSDSHPSPSPPPSGDQPHHGPEGIAIIDDLGFDQVTLTGTGDTHADVIEALMSHGFRVLGRESGVKWFNTAVDLLGGGIVAWDHRAKVDSWMLELPGAQWSRDPERVRTAVFDIVDRFPLCCTRLDIRRDLLGRKLPLLDDIDRACAAGLLCRAKVYTPIEERLAQSPGQFTGRGVYLGSRSSNRFVRVYDKGLERGCSVDGVWVRFEAQFRKDLADQALRAITAAGSDWLRAAFDQLIGVVDFRETVERHATIEERPRPAFWSAFCDGRAGVRASTRREETDADGFLRWLRTAVVPTLLALADRLELTLPDAFALLTPSFQGVKAGGSQLVVEDLAARLSPDGSRVVQAA